MVGDVATPFDGNSQGTCTDCTTKGPDGRLDVVCMFSKEAIVRALGAVSDGECKVLTLTGCLLDGRRFRGRDVVRIVKK